MDKLDGKTLDLTQVNINKLKELFPEILVDGKIDFDKLKLLLGEDIELSNEKYNFSWVGKSKAIKYSQVPSTGTLLPCKENSDNWDLTQNLYIEGDNFEVLKLLQKTYFGKIKVIYIDPPYNTGHDFIYEDDFNATIDNYKKLTSQINRANPDTNGRFHTDWLNMMYPRLILAKNLLKSNGAIFISIGQNELSNLQKMCDEIFGETNRCGIISRVMKSGGGKGQYFSPNIEYILVYAKDTNSLSNFKEPISEEIIKKLYTSTETEGPRKGEKYRPFGLYQSSLDPLRGCNNQRYYIEAPDGTLLIPPGSVFPEIKEDGAQVIPLTANDKVWRWSKERYILEKEKGNIVFKKSDGVLLDENGNPAKWNVYTKIWLSDRQEEGMVPVDLITKWENRQSAKELAEINIPFDFAKPVDLIAYLISLVEPEKGDIILDFFSGSATTANAVLKLNCNDNFKRKYIMVQLPELCDEGSDEKKAGFNNLCQIGEERIRRSSKILYKSLKEKYDNSGFFKDGLIDPDSVDFGFKVFKLESTNIKPWDGSNTIDEQTIFDYSDTIKEDRTNLDVAYEIMIKYGIFNMPLNEIKINNKTMYNIGDGYMIICLEDDVTSNDVKEIANLKPHCVVFKEKGFADDNEKINATYTLERLGVEDVKCI